MTHIPNMTTIRAEIKQLHTELRAATSIPLLIPITTDTLKVVDLFADKLPICASGKRDCDDNDDLEDAQFEVARGASIVDERD